MNCNADAPQAAENKGAKNHACPCDTHPGETAMFATVQHRDATNGI
jgi:hypothetical protein